MRAAKATLQRDGFEIHQGVVDSDTLVELLREADVVRQASGKVNVRNLCAISSRFAELARSTSITGLVPGGLRPVRSILFDKTQESNWPVAWHQDLTICVVARRDVAGYGPWSIKDNIPHVQAPVELLERMITVRLHLDDTFASNGALRVIPGSHNLGITPAASIPNLTAQDATICECRSGDVLVLSPLLLHSSGRSEALRRRRVVHIEYAPLESLHPDLAWFESRRHRFS